MRPFILSPCLASILCLCLVLQAVHPLPHSSLFSYAPPNHEPQAVSKRSIPTPLGDGWTMHVNNIGCFTPFSIASSDLAAFYGGILFDARARLNAGQPRQSHLLFRYGLLSLFLKSTELLEWEWVVEFVEEIVSHVHSWQAFLLD